MESPTAASTPAPVPVPTPALPAGLVGKAVAHDGESGVKEASNAKSHAMLGTATAATIVGGAALGCRRSLGCRDGPERGWSRPGKGERQADHPRRARTNNITSTNAGTSTSVSGRQDGRAQAAGWQSRAGSRRRSRFQQPLGAPGGAHTPRRRAALANRGLDCGNAWRTALAARGRRSRPRIRSGVERRRWWWKRRLGQTRWRPRVPRPTAVG